MDFYVSNKNINLIHIIELKNILRTSYYIKYILWYKTNKKHFAKIEDIINIEKKYNVTRQDQTNTVRWIYS